MRAGSTWSPAARKRGKKACVTMKGALTLISRILSNPISGNSSMGAPHVAPALLTKMCNASCSAETALRTVSIPSAVVRSAGTDVHNSPNSSAAASQASALREVMNTFTPLATRPLAIM